MHKRDFACNLDKHEIGGIPNSSSIHADIISNAEQYTPNAQARIVNQEKEKGTPSTLNRELQDN